MTIGGMFESLKQRGYVADRKYEAGEISEKTGLQKQPNYRAAIRTSKKSEILIETKNCVAVLDISPNKKYIEVVDWRIIRDKSVREMEKQAKRNAVEDGRSLYNSSES